MHFDKITAFNLVRLVKPQVINLILSVHYTQDFVAYHIKLLKYAFSIYSRINFLIISIFVLLVDLSTLALK